MAIPSNTGANLPASVAGVSAPTNRGSLMLDPDWPGYSFWQNPLGKSLAFQFVDFQDSAIEETSVPNWTSTDPVGRAEPYQSYAGTSAREITLNFTFMNQSGDLLREVVYPGRFLDALKYPVYSYAQGISYPPPTCFIRIGSLLTARVIMTGGSPAWRGPIDPDTMLPHQCEFSATFTVVRRFATDLNYRNDGQWV